MSEPTKPKRVTSDKVFEALERAGLFSADEKVTRAVIDLQVGVAPRIYVERWGDSRLIDVLPTALRGVEIREVERPAQERQTAVFADVVAEATANPGHAVEVKLP